MIDWAVSCWHGRVQNKKGHALVEGESACGACGVWHDEWRILETLPVEQRPNHEHFNSICKRCDQYVRKHF